jgi:phage-related protein
VTAYINVTKWGANMIAKGIQTGSDFVSKVITFIKELPSKAWTWLNDTIGKAKTFAIELARKGTEGAKNLVTNIVNGVRELPSKMLDIGKNVVKGIWNGIKDMGGWIKDKISGFCGGIVKGFKKALGIHSPSRVLKDSVGKYMAMGIGVGFEDEMANVTKEMQNAIPTSFDVGTNLNGSTDYNQTSLNQMDMVGAFKDALSQMKIELDDEVAGKFVEKTVARAIYT